MTTFTPNSLLKEEGIIANIRQTKFAFERHYNQLPSFLIYYQGLQR